jgi:DNA-binding NtrC family response regulator
MTLEEVQSHHLEYVLKQVDGNKARAAEILGVSRATIYVMLARRIGNVCHAMPLTVAATSDRRG